MTDVIDYSEIVGQCEIHFLEAGETGGQDIILLHGMKFKAQTWQELGTLETLAANGNHAVALDLPGFGGSPQCQRSPDEVLVDCISQKKYDKPILIGPSMGGRVALEFCLNHPGLIGGLVLVGAVGVQENKERLAEITVPTLIVWGGEDAISPLENGRLLHDTINNSSLVIIDGAPHPCYLDQPAMWHQELLAFLGRM